MKPNRIQIDVDRLAKALFAVERGRRRSKWPRDGIGFTASTYRLEPAAEIDRHWKMVLAAGDHNWVVRSWRNKARALIKALARDHQKGPNR